MKLSEAVHESMSYIDESYLAESEAEVKMTFSWKPFLSFAAVCVLVMAVLFNPSKTADSSVPSAAQNNAAEVIEEEAVTDGLPSGEVLIDQKLIEMLNQMNDSDVIRVRIEKVVSGGYETIEYNTEQKDAETAPETDTAYDNAEEYLEMSKLEILSFEGEEGITYIFHLYEADETE